MHIQECAIATIETWNLKRILKVNTRENIKMNKMLKTEENKRHSDCVTK